MAYLGRANLLYRLGRTIWGWFAPPPAPAPLPSVFYIIGHRGAPMVAPENTLPGFTKALDFGANAIETDICMTRDRRFLLWHDADPNAIVALARQWGGEGLLYVPEVPALGSPWRQPVRKLALAALRKFYRYICRQPAASSAGEEPPPHALPTIFDDFISWLQHERRLQHVFLDLKFTPEEQPAALFFLKHLEQLHAYGDLRADVTFHIMSPHREVVAALLHEARRTPLPTALRLYADFELPGVRRGARGLGVRHICMGCGVRTWGEFRHEVAQVVAARNRGQLDTVVVWTVNDAARLQELVALGVDGVITDDSALLHRTVLDRRCHLEGQESQTRLPNLSS